MPGFLGNRRGRDRVQAAVMTPAARTRSNAGQPHQGLVPARPRAGARAMVGGGAIAAGILLAVLPGTGAAATGSPSPSPSPSPSKSPSPSPSPSPSKSPSPSPSPSKSPSPSPSPSPSKSP